MYYVYILYSPLSRKKYVGITSNLKERFNRHNSGQSKFTAKERPWRLIYYESFNNKTDAIREEKFLKTGRGRERIQFLLKETLENFNNQKRKGG